MRRPNFFIVGAPKCGTTAMSEYLRTHPRIYFSPIKEPYYFSSDFVGFGTTLLDDYLRLFAKARPEHQAVGEASVWYLYSQVALARIREFEPSAKIIAMLRNPVDLAYSLHSELYYCFAEDQADFATAWELQAERSRGQCLPPGCPVPQFLQYRDACSLGLQVKRMLETFPREQIHFLLFDDLVRDTKRCYESLLAFLNVPSDGRLHFPRINENKRHRSRRLCYLLMRKPGSTPRALRCLKRTLGLEYWGISRYLLRLATRPAVREPLDPALEQRLVAEFRDDVLLLSELLHRDLSGWLKLNSARPER
jgi:hypothetical protein